MPFGTRSSRVSAPQTLSQLWVPDTTVGLAHATPPPAKAPVTRTKLRFRTIQNRHKDVAVAGPYFAIHATRVAAEPAALPAPTDSHRHDNVELHPPPRTRLRRQRRRRNSSRDVRGDRFCA